MFSTIDERKGCVKQSWQDVRERVKQVDPTFAALVDELSPDDSFPVFLVYLPYGSLKGDTISSFIPTQDGKFYRLSDPTLPKEIRDQLGYGVNSSPLGMVLEKQLEYFVKMSGTNTAIPWHIYGPGTFFPLYRMLDHVSHRVYEPNNIFSTAAGSRSAFMLPNINCATNYFYLKRELNLKMQSPASFHEHWFLFKDILESEAIKCDWRACLIYFSEKWVHMLHNDRAWLPLKVYFHQQVLMRNEYNRIKLVFDFYFSEIQKNKNLKPNPYLTDTIKNIYALALGNAIGYKPATDESALPLDILQEVFVQFYKLTKYIPTIMQPATFTFEEDDVPIYYSLKHLTMQVFSPKSRTVSSIMHEMRELVYILEKMQGELIKKNNICSDTVLNEVARKLEIKFFHDKYNHEDNILPSTILEELDPRFTRVSTANKMPKAKFCSEAKFFRGCISIKTKNEN